MAFWLGLPLEKDKLTCKFVSVIPALAVPCVPAYDRALAETVSKPHKNWTLHSVPSTPLPGIEVDHGA